MKPTSAAAHLKRAFAFESRGQYAEAVEEYGEAVRCDPEDAHPRVRLGLLLRQLGRDEEANLAFESALTLRLGGARPVQQSFLWTPWPPSRRRAPEGSGNIEP